jgi:hypothetical protein
MNRLFTAERFFLVPDGTRVAPVFNPLDLNARELPIDLLQGASLALGEIAPGCASQPHLHPIVSQVTWVLEGELLVRMKGPGSGAAYELGVGRGEAVLTEPMTFIQLVNARHDAAARVLYVVTPAYVHAPGADGYDDAVVLSQTWEELAAAGFPLAWAPDPEAAASRRALALERIRAGGR